MIVARDPDLTLAEARRIAADGFVFGFPVMLVDAVRRTHPIGPNQILRLPADSSTIAPGLAGEDPQILRTSAWADLSEGPVQVALPDLEGRRCSVALYDAWGRLVEVLDACDLAPSAPKVALTGPDWRRVLPSGFVAKPVGTNLVWIVTRLAAKTDADYETAERLLDQQTLTPIGGEPAPARPLSTVEPPARSSVDWVNGLDPQRFFHRLAVLLDRYPPNENARSTLASLERIGVVAGEEFRPPSDLALQEAIAQGLVDGRTLVRQARQELGAEPSGWRRASHLAAADPGALARSAAARLGAAGPANMLELTCEVDDDGRPLNGSERYALHFPSGNGPPVDGFWTLKLAHTPRSGELKLQRSVLGDRDRLDFGPDGSLELLLQHSPPEAAEASNWLPVPPGPFSLCLNLYWPKLSAISEWRPPSPHRLDTRARRAVDETWQDKELPQ